MKTYASFVKFAHTVFALPFAIVGMAAAHAVPTGFLYVLPGPAGVPPYPGGFDRHVPFFWALLLLILACMVGARSFAMAVNRILDRRIDALNPRTAARELPAGTMTLPQAWAFAIVMAALYFGACWIHGPVVFALSPIPIVLMLLYPLTKRFTSLCHVVLGFSLGLAPVGAWVAIRGLVTTTGGKLAGSFPIAAEMIGEAPYGTLFDWGQVALGWNAVAEPAPWLLAGAVAMWVAGFDVIYALQDVEFDRANRLHSIPAKLGRRGALWVSRGMHALAAALFFAFVYALLNPPPFGGMDVSSYTQLAPWVWAAPGLMLAGMLYQHSLVKADDLSRVDLAFFTVNGVISVGFGTIFVAAWLLG
ncbi:MAG: UbiA family prenyltransferase [Planctomycetes bacterium]|nr:UbiA family prenyltransferase [Planctomycetota bacterium]